MRMVKKRNATHLAFAVWPVYTDPNTNRIPIYWARQVNETDKTKPARPPPFDLLELASLRGHQVPVTKDIHERSIHFAHNRMKSPTVYVFLVYDDQRPSQFPEAERAHLSFTFKFETVGER